ncbi:tRNA pseudouridine32 synthase / 23S rRNA pseudouridine746 synthase [Streptomyces sp. DvalAA-14]|uniref:RluA family pseudouridine synthase n=1 Tax=unclassified Streptomyces TaxID=2593676 RepID=UPI00081BB535|nr:MULTISPECIES: RluA family pseudouridine synthase [unclassified Streptomyces]MYS21357.1 pseudouridylate synthase [Streptomyces sp. SID4948]SCD90432.1 tRNA pseudouridine32 synthase / 23S rRNA pseudouridine746 synthase [Streptomyces sp. DvalAA-14]
MARRPGRKAPPSPLEQRDGVDPVCLRLPGGSGHDGKTAGPEGAGPTTIRGYLLERYAAAIGPERVEAMLAAGRFVGEGGRPVDTMTPYEAGSHVWFHRDFAPESPVPFAIEVVHRDDRIVVADKPHFLATTPRGRHITQTAVARLRRDLGLPRLSPAHRLDRLTAGLVLFVVRPEDRGAYQTLFRDRRVRKEYEAVAAYDPAVELPRTVRSRIVKEHGVLAAQEVPGPVNAESRIELLAHRGGLGHYLLLPSTGRTHQLRVHMNALGLPLLNDPLYPETAPELAEDDPGRFDGPLQLLARTVEFSDPWTGRPLRFESRRELASWRDAEKHADERDDAG